MTRGYEREVMRSVRPEAIERYNWPEVTIPRRWSTNRYDTMNWFSRKCEFPHIVDKIGLIESVELIAIRGNFNNFLIFNNFFFPNFRIILLQTIRSNANKSFWHWLFENRNLDLWLYELGSRNNCVTLNNNYVFI